MSSSPYRQIQKELTLSRNKSPSKQVSIEYDYINDFKNEVGEFYNTTQHSSSCVISYGYSNFKRNYSMFKIKDTEFQSTNEIKKMEQDLLSYFEKKRESSKIIRRQVRSISGIKSNFLNELTSFILYKGEIKTISLFEDRSEIIRDEKSITSNFSMLASFLKSFPNNEEVLYLELDYFILADHKKLGFEMINNYNFNITDAINNFKSRVDNYPSKDFGQYIYYIFLMVSAFIFGIPELEEIAKYFFDKSHSPKFNLNNCLRKIQTFFMSKFNSPSLNYIIRLLFFMIQNHDMVEYNFMNYFLRKINNSLVLDIDYQDQIIFSEEGFEIIENPNSFSFTSIEKNREKVRIINQKLINLLIKNPSDNFIDSFYIYMDSIEKVILMLMEKFQYPKNTNKQPENVFGNLNSIKMEIDKLIDCSNPKLFEELKTTIKNQEDIINEQAKKLKEEEEKSSKLEKFIEESDIKKLIRDKTTYDEKIKNLESKCQSLEELNNVIQKIEKDLSNKEKELNNVQEKCRILQNEINIRENQITLLEKSTKEAIDKTIKEYEIKTNELQDEHKKIKGEMIKNFENINLELKKINTKQNADLNLIQNQLQEKNDAYNRSILIQKKNEEEFNRRLFSERKLRINLKNKFIEKLLKCKLYISIINEQKRHLKENLSLVPEKLKLSIHETLIKIKEYISKEFKAFTNKFYLNKSEIENLKKENLMLIQENQTLYADNSSMKNQLQIQMGELNNNKIDNANLSNRIADLDNELRIQLNEIKVLSIQKKSREELVDRYKKSIRIIEKGKIDTLNFFAHLFLSSSRNSIQELELVKKEKKTIEKRNQELEKKISEKIDQENKIIKLEKEKCDNNDLINLCLKFLNFLDDVEKNDEEKKYLISIRSELDLFSKAQNDINEDLDYKEKVKHFFNQQKFNRFSEWISNNFLEISFHLNNVKLNILNMHFQNDTGIEKVINFLFNLDEFKMELSDESLNKRIIKIIDHLKSIATFGKGKGNNIIEKKENGKSKFLSEIKLLCSNLFSNYISDFKTILDQTNMQININAKHQFDIEKKF